MEPAKTNSQAPAGVEPWRHGAKLTAIIALSFSLVIAVLLLINFYQSRHFDPINSAELIALRAALAKEPGSDALKNQIRQTDLQLRQKVVRRQALSQQAGWLLVIGMGVFLVAIKPLLYRKKLPRPAKRQASAELELRAAVRNSWGVAGFAVVALSAAGFWAGHTSSALTPTRLAASEPAPTSAAPAPEPPKVAPSTPFPTDAEIQQNWPRFRGPSGSGVSTNAQVVTRWDLQTGENILWKSAVPIFGPNSPVLWGNRLFMTGATAKKCEIYCYDADTGKLLWQSALAKLPGESDEPPTVSEDVGGFASSTAATDGRRVYAIFANGNLAALDYDGKTVWAFNLGKPDNSYGHASSLELFENRVLVLFDQSNGKDGKSKLLAFDTATGNKVWESAPRPVPNSWATPILIHAANRNQVITCGNPWVISYDPANGTEFWRAKVLYGEVTPSPISANGLVFTVMEGEKLSAIKPDGSGDVTKSHILWQAEDGLPEIPSPVCDGQHVYLITSSGLLTCYNAADGKKLYEKDLEQSIKASPAVAGNHLYLWTDKGLCIVAETGAEYKEVGRSDLGEDVLASPAFLGNRMFIRAKKNLFCLGPKTK